MQKIEDTEYRWKGFGYRGSGDFDSFCNLRIFEGDDRTFVIVTDLRVDSGASITNSAEHIATLILRDYKLDPVKLVWVENYPKHKEYKDLTPHNELSMVSFTWETVLPVGNSKYPGCEYIAVLPSWRHIGSFDAISPELAQLIDQVDEDILQELERLMATINPLIEELERHHRPISTALSIFQNTFQSYLLLRDEFGRIQVTVTGDNNDNTWRYSWRGTVSGLKNLYDYMLSLGIKGSSLDTPLFKRLYDSKLKVEYVLRFEFDSDLESRMLIDSSKKAALMYEDLRECVIDDLNLEDE